MSINPVFLSTRMKQPQNLQLEENFILKRPFGLICKVCYMQKVDISEIYPQQTHQAQGISEEAKVT